VSDTEELCLCSDDDVYAALKAMVDVQGTQLTVAWSLGVSPQYITDILRRRRNISKEFAAKLGFVPSLWPWVKVK